MDCDVQAAREQLLGVGGDDPAEVHSALSKLSMLGVLTTDQLAQEAVLLMKRAPPARLLRHPDFDLQWCFPSAVAPFCSWLVHSYVHSTATGLAAAPPRLRPVLVLSFCSGALLFLPCLINHTCFPQSPARCLRHPYFDLSWCFLSHWRPFVLAPFNHTCSSQPPARLLRHTDFDLQWCSPSAVTLSPVLACFGHMCIPQPPHHKSMALLAWHCRCGTADVVLLMWTPTRLACRVFWV